MSTPACRAARAADTGHLAEADHVVAYRDALGPFHTLVPCRWDHHLP